MFLSCQHEDAENQFCSEDRFEEQPLHNGCIGVECGTNGERSGQQYSHNPRSRDASQYLGEDEERCFQPADGSYQSQCHAHLGRTSVRLNLREVDIAVS